MFRKTRTRTLYRLAPGPDAPHLARQIAAREVRDSDGKELAENASLLLSELVAERMQHTRTQTRMTVDIVRAARMRWCVVDRGTPALPGGLRLTALDALADAWGVSRRHGTTRTWFELRFSSRA